MAARRLPFGQQRTCPSLLGFLWLSRICECLAFRISFAPVCYLFLESLIALSLIYLLHEFQICPILVAWATSLLERNESEHELDELYQEVPGAQMVHSRSRSIPRSESSLLALTPAWLEVHLLEFSLLNQTPRSKMVPSCLEDVALEASLSHSRS